MKKTQPSRSATRIPGPGMHATAPQAARSWAVPWPRRIIDGSTRVAQSRGNAVDREVDAAPQPLVLGRALAARAVAAHQLDLQVVQRIEIGEAVLDRSREGGIGLQSRGVAG